MPGPKKKSIEELEKEVAELIAKSGRCEEDIFTDFKDYCALNKRSNTHGSILNNRDILRKKYLHSAFLLCQSIINKRKKIQAARKAVAANVSAASATSAAASNVVNTSISSAAAPADSSTSSSTTANRNRASIDYTPPPSGISSSSCASSNDTTIASLVSICCWASCLFLHRIL